jgi:hypothetical protein
MQHDNYPGTFLLLRAKIDSGQALNALFRAVSAKGFELTQRVYQYNLEQKTLPV